MKLIFPLPIRLRLALWFFSIFAAATLAIGVLSIWMVHRSILDLENNELHERIRGVERFLENRPPGETLASLENAMRVYDVTHGGKWLQVIDQKGQWLYRSEHIEDIYPFLDLPQQVGNSERPFDFTTGALHVRALIATIHMNGRSYTVQTGMTLNKRLHVLGNFRLHLILLIPAILIVAAIAGYFVSSRALSPVASITNEAQRISSKNLDTRLPVPQTHDELAAMSETLNRMLNRIDAGYRSVKEFTANAAHELRAPVSRIRAEAEIALALSRSSDEYRGTLQNVGVETVRMGAIIDDLLVLARADAGVQTLRFEPLDMNQMLHAATARWRPLLQKSDIELLLTTLDEKAIVMVDPSSIERLLDILIENAWKYSPVGSQIRLGTSDEPGFILLSVADSGSGIPLEHQGKIFERFYRVNPGNNGSKETQGSGLGLALARWIAEVHGTKVVVKSESGKGSCFSAKFARSGFEAASEATTDVISAEASELQPDWEGLKKPTWPA